VKKRRAKAVQTAHEPREKLREALFKQERQLNLMAFVPDTFFCPFLPFSLFLGAGAQPLRGILAKEGVLCQSPARRQFVVP